MIQFRSTVVVPTMDRNRTMHWYGKTNCFVVLCSKCTCIWHFCSPHTRFESAVCSMRNQTVVVRWIVLLERPFDQSSNSQNATKSNILISNARHDFFSTLLPAACFDPNIYTDWCFLPLNCLLVHHLFRLQNQHTAFWNTYCSCHVLRPLLLELIWCCEQSTQQDGYPWRAKLCA